MKNICVVGAGNVGVSLAVDISNIKNISVKILTSKAEQLKPSFRKIDLETGIECNSKNILITSDYKLAFDNVDLIIVTLPSFLIKDFINKVDIFNPKVILFVPGYGGKELYCTNLIDRGIIIAGLDRSPYVSRLKDSNTVVASKKTQVRIGYMNNPSNLELTTELQKILNINLVPLKNYLTISLTPSNPILHTARLYSLFRKNNFNTKFPRMIKFYAEWNNFSSTIMLKMDAELQKICHSLGDIDLSDVIPLVKHYEAPTKKAMTKKIQSIKSFQNINAPMIKIKNYFYIEKSSRYFIEDFSYGLALIKSYGVLAKVKTPTIDKVLRWYQNISGEQFFLKKDFIGKALKTLPIPLNFGITNIQELEKFYK